MEQEDNQLGIITEEFIKRLGDVRDDYRKCKEELKVSIRIDVISTNIKAIIEDTNTYEELKNKLEDYLGVLYKDIQQGKDVNNK